MTTLAEFDLDLDVFEGPFDLLLAIILRKEIDLKEVDLAQIVVAYLDRLDEQGELDLESATRFLLLIAGLLELKTRLMLPTEPGDDGSPIEPSEAVLELLERLIEYRRYKSASEWFAERFEAESSFRYRDAPLPRRFASAHVVPQGPIFDAARLGRSIGELLRKPPPLDLRHLGSPQVTLRERIGFLRRLLSAHRSVSFDDAVRDADRVTEAVTLFALLELYKRGEAEWRQGDLFGPIEIRRTGRPLAAGGVGA